MWQSFIALHPRSSQEGCSLFLEWEAASISVNLQVYADEGSCFWRSSRCSLVIWGSILRPQRGAVFGGCPGYKRAFDWVCLAPCNWWLAMEWLAHRPGRKRCQPAAEGEEVVVLHHSHMRSGDPLQKTHRSSNRKASCTAQYAPDDFLLFREHIWSVLFIERTLGIDQGQLLQRPPHWQSRRLRKSTFSA